MSILVTGSAGFIGNTLTRRLIDEDLHVVGVDNHNDYYDVNLKNARIKLIENTNYIHYKNDINDLSRLDKIFREHEIEYVVNLAAQAGVRYSIENPHAYISANISGFMNILELSKKYSVKHLIYASSSSVYGANRKIPFSTSDNVDHPISLYAATKKSNELMAHTYSALFNLPTTGLRFFTVYGPYGRPDMALFKFTKLMLEGKPIEVYNNGNHVRDFTYIDDIVESIKRITFKPASPNPKWDPKSPDPSSSFAPWRVFNIGNNNPVNLMDYIETIEDCLEITAEKIFLPLQDGDVPETFAEVDDLYDAISFKPEINYKQGIKKFIDWYLEYYKFQ